MLDLPKRFIIFDTEYTSWEGAQGRGWSGLNEFREIVQIGSILVDGETLEEKSSLLLFVKPVKNPVLSDYLIKLTGITQDEVVENGMTLREALLKLKEWAGERNFYCFGDDGQVIQENCGLISIDFPFDILKFRDIREVFEKNDILTKGYSSGTLVRAFGVEPARRGHDALNDARQILDALIELRKLK